MKRLVLRTLMAVVLVALEWAAGTAQTTQPDFEFVVSSPAGDTQVECLRGCKLSWVERGLNPNAQLQPTFTYSCNAPQGRCSSNRIGGWITR